jgi:hypothetical protein
MLIAYLTTDPVNQDLAQKLAQACKSQLLVPSLGQALPEDLIDAVAYDLDYLPPSQQQEVLSALGASRAPYPVAVHSYNLEREQRLALRKNGVLVARRLRMGLFKQLCRNAMPGQGRRLVRIPAQA